MGSTVTSKVSNSVSSAKSGGNTIIIIAGVVILIMLIVFGYFLYKYINQKRSPQNQNY